MAASTYNIGKVVKKLEPTHPGLSISKVRYLESKGLVNPQRTKSGYRVYTDEDIRRLDAVLKLQETCFYPLQVIKDKLDAADGAPLEELSSREVQAAEEDMIVHSPHFLDDLPALIGIPISFVRQLSEAGIVTIQRGRHGREFVDGHDVPTIRSAFELKRYGLEPRLLRQYVQQANRELPTFRQILSTTMGRQGTLDDPRTVETFDTTLANLLELTGRIRNDIVRQSLRREFKHPEAQCAPVE